MSDLARVEADGQYRLEGVSFQSGGCPTKITREIISDGWQPLAPVTQHASLGLFHYCYERAPSTFGVSIPSDVENKREEPSIDNITCFVFAVFSL